MRKMACISEGNSKEWGARDHTSPDYLPSQRFSATEFEKSGPPHDYTTTSNRTQFSLACLEHGQKKLCNSFRSYSTELGPRQRRHEHNRKLVVKWLTLDKCNLDRSQKTWNFSDVSCRDTLEKWFCIWSNCWVITSLLLSKIQSFKNLFWDSKMISLIWSRRQ